MVFIDNDCGDAVHEVRIALNLMLLGKRLVHDEVDVAILCMTKDESVGIVKLHKGLLYVAHKCRQVLGRHRYVLVDHRLPCLAHGPNGWHKPLAKLP